MTGPASTPPSPMMMPNGLLPTTVVGSYPVPEWLERLKTDYYQRRISAQHLNEIHEVAIKAALKDQELTGLDIVSDGELRRDNDIDYLLTRIPGVDIPHRAKTDYYDYYDAAVTRPLPDPAGEGVGLGLALSRGLTEAMGGTLEPEETPGGGLTMTLSLPAVPDPVGPDPGGPHLDGPDPGGSHPGGPRPGEPGRLVE